MKGVGAESGVKAEAIVFLNYSKDFSQTRQAGFVHLTKSRRRISGRRLREQNPSPACAVLRQKPDLPRQLRNVELSTRRRVPGRGPPQGQK